jgi:hypothetical protein
MRARVAVTERDITEGVRTSCHRCPVALALLRTLRSLRKLDERGRVHVCRDGWYPVVGTDYGHLSDRSESGDESHRPWPPGDAVRAFTAAFDAGDAVKPLTFDVEVD